MRLIDSIKRTYQSNKQTPAPDPLEWQPLDGDEGMPMTRAVRRRMGIYGLVQKPQRMVVARYVRRHYVDGMFDKFGPAVYTRRQRRHRARIMRAMKARGL